MPDLGLIGWIIVGLLAGGISGWFVGTRSVQGCLPTMVVGIVGGVIGGYIVKGTGNGAAGDLFGALVFATIGSILFRIVLRAIEQGNRR